MLIRFLLVLIWASHSYTVHADNSEFPVADASAFIEQEIRAGNTAGAAIAIIRDGRVIYANGYGVTETERGEAITPHHAFRSASTFKMMVGMVLVNLHETGQMDLDAPISTYLENLDPAIGRVTTRQLLNHTSGILDTSVEHSTPTTMTLSEYARSLDSSFLYVSPGASFSYSNPGYALAGAVIEAVTQLSFPQAMERHLFAPLGMTHSTFDLDTAMANGLAVGHQSNNGVLEPITPVDTGLAAMPSGTLISTVLDYARFLAAIMNDGVFEGRAVWKSSAVELMQTPQIPDVHRVTSYSYSFGLMNGSFHSHRAFFHSGGMPGYASNVLILPDLDLAIVLFTNGEDLDRREVLYRIVSAFADLETASPRPAPTGLTALDEQQAQPLIGRYAQRDDLPVIDIYVDGEQVMLRNRGVDYRLHHQEGEFYIGIAENGNWFRFRIADTPDGRYRVVQWWIRSFARPL